MSYPVKPPDDAPVKGAKYIHYKTNDVYTVLHMAYHTEIGDWLVIYRKGSAHTAPCYARPLSVWNEPVINEDGKWVKRFKLETLFSKLGGK